MDTSGTELVELHHRALEGFALRVHSVAPTQWHVPTPCTDWDVHALVGHLVGEQLWAVPLLHGAGLEDAGRQVPDDPLGEDAVAAWDAAAEAVRRTVAEEGVLDRTVHLSYGDVPAAHYLRELTFDLVVHTWDLARAVDADEHLDPAAVEAVLAFVSENPDSLSASGLFAPPVPVPDGASSQTRLLALTGRAVQR
jgi:uncharacterized protein (TIGR03086 family)